MGDKPCLVWERAGDLLRGDAGSIVDSEGWQCKGSSPVGKDMRLDCQLTRAGHQNKAKMGSTSSRTTAFEGRLSLYRTGWRALSAGPRGVFGIPDYSNAESYHEHQTKPECMGTISGRDSLSSLSLRFGLVLSLLRHSPHPPHGSLCQIFAISP